MYASERPAPPRYAPSRRKAGPSACPPASTGAKRSPCARDALEHDVHRERRAGRAPRSPRPSASGVETGAPGLRPHRVDGRDRLPLAVLVRVDQHAAPLRLRPLGRDEPAVRRARARRRRSPRTRACPRRSSGARSGRARGSRREPLVFGKRLEPERVERLLDEQRDLRPSPRSRRRRDGSRSKSTQSGRSGLSTREYHVFMSMQPMFTIQSSASSSLTSGAVDRALRRGVSRVETSAAARVGIHSGMCLRRVLLEEVTCPASRRGSASS